MASSANFKDFVMEQIAQSVLKGSPQLHFRKMFGEYFIYLNGQPAFLICNDRVYVKQYEELQTLLRENERSIPFVGAKEWFVLDIENLEILGEVVEIFEEILPHYYSQKTKSKGI